jgi:ribosomal protein S18 acetylase RimI-like enzyme
VEVTLKAHKPRVATRAVAPLKQDQLELMSAIFGAAFENDPLIKFVEPNEQKRAQIAPFLYGTVLKYCQLFGQVDVTTDGMAAAAWLAPNHCFPSILRELRAGMGMLPIKCGLGAFNRLQEFDILSKKMRRKFAPPTHWYLWGIAVDPSMQGKGLARALLNSVIQKADRAGETIYLETQNPNNVVVYERFGFRVVGIGNLGRNAVTIHAMRREPKPITGSWKTAA